MSDCLLLPWTQELCFTCKHKQTSYSVTLFPKHNGRSCFIRFWSQTAIQSFHKFPCIVLITVSRRPAHVRSIWGLHRRGAVRSHAHWRPSVETNTVAHTFILKGVSTCTSLWLTRTSHSSNHFGGQFQKPNEP